MKNRRKRRDSGPLRICDSDSHEWVVFSTALAEVWLMVQCVRCGAHGTVDDPSKDEWAEAFTAPLAPYLWADNARVTLRHRTGPCYVRLAEGGPA